MVRLKSRTLTVASRFQVFTMLACEIVLPLPYLAVFIQNFIPVVSTVWELAIYGQQCKYVTAEKSERTMIEKAPSKNKAGGTGVEKVKDSVKEGKNVRGKPKSAGAAA